MHDKRPFVSSFGSILASSMIHGTKAASPNIRRFGFFCRRLSFHMMQISQLLRTFKASVSGSDVIGPAALLNSDHDLNTLELNIFTRPVNPGSVPYHLRPLVVLKYQKGGPQRFRLLTDKTCHHCAYDYGNSQVTYWISNFSVFRNADSSSLSSI